METTDKLINSSPNSSDYDDQHPDPNDYVNQSATHKVSFAFNRLKIDENDSNKQQSIPESDETDDNSSPSSDRNDYVNQSAAHEVSFAFNRLKIESNKQQSMAESDETVNEDGENDDDEVSFAFNRLKIESNKQQSIPESPETDENESRKQQFTPESPENDDEKGENDDEDDDEEEEEEEGDFTFMCIGDDNDSPTSEVLENRQIHQVFPLFDQSLLSGGDSDGERRRLPIHVPVDKVFIESPRRRSPSSSVDESTAGASSATLCALPTESETGAPEMNMKSNSTGFSKLWRFRDKMNRSNSDGRDAFVFLEPSRTTTSSSSSKTTSSSSSVSIGKSNAVDEFDSPEKVNGGGGKGKAVKKAKKLTASAHEVYLKQRGGQTEDERRKRRSSYLPYRPGLMGFFTNVNGGLSKNVHPF